MIAIKDDYCRQRLVESTKELMRERKNNHDLEIDCALVNLELMRLKYERHHNN